MGYNAEQTGQSVLIRRENLEALHAALKALWKRTDLMGGGDSDGRRWFSWCNDCDPERDSLPELLEGMGWKPTLSPDGDIVALTFQWEKLGDEKHLFAAMAPFVETGSWIEMLGQEGYRWRWTFDGQCVREVGATVTWEV